MAPIDINWSEVLCDEEPQREQPTPRRRRLASPEQQEDVAAPRRNTLAEKAGEGRVQAPGATGRPPVRASSCSSKAAPVLPRQVPKEVSPEKIFEALRDIRDLARADLLRGYSMFIRDDRRFRALMVLPEDMRLEWLLMEIDLEQLNN